MKFFYPAFSQQSSLGIRIFFILRLVTIRPKMWGEFVSEKNEHFSSGYNLFNFTFGFEK